MASHSRRRLIRDFKKLQMDPPYGVSGSPASNDIMKWNAVIFGPEDTPWEGGTFQLVLDFHEDYPNKPPKVKFLSKLFHPNVYTDGSICLDILQNQWSPIYDVSAILTSIQSLLSDPNPNSPANSEAAHLFLENRREYNRRVQECATESWRSIEFLVTNYSQSSATSISIGSTEHGTLLESNTNSSVEYSVNSFTSINRNNIPSSTEATNNCTNFQYNYQMITNSSISPEVAVPHEETNNGAGMEDDFSDASEG